MFGFTCIRVSKNVRAVKVPFTDMLQIEVPNGDKLYFSHLTNKRFKADKILKETKKYVFGLDGVLLNSRSLKRSYALADLEYLIPAMRKKLGNSFFKDFKGEFSGFFYDKDRDELIIFTNQTGTKRVYYFKGKDYFISVPDFKVIAQTMEANGIQRSLDLMGAYGLLTLGGMFEDHTLIDSVKKLEAGKYLLCNQKGMFINKYCDFNAYTYTGDSKKKIIENLDTLFESAINLEYEKDLEYGYRHFTTLSGGLDSRMNVMVSDKMGYKDKTSLCFSQSRYKDETIARKIAGDLGCDFRFVPLDDGNYMLDVDENIDIYNGMIFHLSSAHFNFSLKRTQFDNFGLIHSGQIGDAILGGLLTAPSDVPANLKGILVSDRLFPEMMELAGESVKDYASENSFKIYNRLFNLTYAGSLVAEQYSYLVSPFFDVDFMEYAISIPPNLKYKTAIYIDWINSKHKDVTRYKWENTGFKPSANWKTSMSRYTKKVKSIYFGKIVKDERKISMNPYTYWYRKNEKVDKLFRKYVDEHKAYLDGYPELKTHALDLFERGNPVEKSMVVTLLVGMKKYLVE